MNAIDVATDKLDQARATAAQCAENAAQDLAQNGKVHPALLAAVTESLAAAAVWEAILTAALEAFAAESAA